MTKKNKTMSDEAITNAVEGLVPLLKGAAESFTRCDRTDPLAEELKAAGAGGTWVRRWDSGIYDGPTLRVLREANWHLKADAEFSLSERRGLQSRVGWPSGGGSLEIAGAQADLHAELVAEARKASTYLHLLMETVSRTAEPARVLHALSELVEEMRRAQGELLRAARAEEKAQG